MSEHHAFRETRGPGSVNQRNHIVRLYAVLDILQIIRRRVGATQLYHLVQVLVTTKVTECVNLVLQLGLVIQNLRDFAQQIPTSHKDELHIGIIENITVIALADSRIDGHVDGADLHDSHVQKVPFRTVRRDCCHAVALLDAQLQQAV